MKHSFRLLSAAMLAALPATLCGQTPGSAPSAAIQSHPVADKLNRLVLVDTFRISLDTLDSTVKLLRLRSVEADKLETDPTKKGVNFLIDPSIDASDIRIDLDLSNVTLERVLERICYQTRLRYQINYDNVTFVPSSVVGEPAPAATTMGKIHRIFVPTINLKEATVEEAIDFLRQGSPDFDTVEPDPDKKGVNFVLRLPEGAESARITLELKNVPLEVALKYICEQANLRYKVEKFAVHIVANPINAQIERKVLLKQYTTALTDFAQAEKALLFCSDPNEMAANEEALAKHQDWIGQLKTRLAQLGSEGNEIEPDKDVAFFEKQYKKKLTGVKPRIEYANPEQFYSAIAEQLGLPEIAWKAAAAKYGWSKNDGKITKTMVKFGPAAADGQATWDVLFFRFGLHPETEKPVPSTAEHVLVQIDQDGDLKVGGLLK